MRGALATDPSDLAVQAAEVLRRSDMGEWTRASPTLYPHQWSWDTGFIAIGLAHLDTRRAARELTSLFAHQWRNGKVPHIVFNPDAPPDSYFPGAEHWSSAGTFPDAPPAPPYTSALCQPPTHALGALRVWELAGRDEPRAGVPREIFQAPCLAPLPCHIQGPGGIGARDHLPSLGERHGQLSKVGRSPRGRRGRRPAVDASART